MKDKDKTKELLIDDLEELRKQVTELKKSETKLMRVYEELERSEQRFKLLYERAPLGYQSLNENGHFIEVNQAFLDMLGYSREEVIGKWFGDFLHPDYVSIFKDSFPRFKEVGETHNAEFEMLKKDGSYTIVLINGKIGYEENGNFKQTHCILNDITKQRKAEENLKLFKELINQSNDAIYIVNPETSHFIEVNETACKLHRYTRDELLAKRVIDIAASLSDENKWKSHVKELKETGSMLAEYEGMRKDGSTFLLEVNLTLVTNRSVKHIVAVGRDITERKKYEETLKMSEKKYRSLIENANDAIISTNQEGIIVDLNERTEKMFGYSREEMLGEHITLIAIPENKERERKTLEEFMKTNKLGIIGTTAEGTGLRKDGKRIPVESSIYSSEIGGEHIITAIIRELTERKEMEHKLLQSEKLKSLGELAGGVAHDFNNVLAAILGRAQLLKMIIESPAGVEEKRKSVIELKEGLDVIEQASRDGAETVRRIQEFARRRDDDKHFATVDLNELIDNALDFTKTRWKGDAESKGIKINIQKELSTLPTTSGSAAELREVFTNLINNAVDAMPQGGEIKIKTYKKDSHIVVNVEDTGVGIADDRKAKIFDPFFTTKGVKSSGLGMSVSYGIISHHRGTISVDSTEGQGTTFTIKLPIREGVVEEKEVKPISGEIKKSRILVIDDEEGVRNLLSAILNTGGHEVETATSGDQGIELYKEKEFDLVFTDLGMPGMSGWQVAEKVKSINGGVPVVLITGWDIKEEESGMKDSYVDLIIQKPFEVEQVLKLVQEGMILRDRFKSA